MNPEEIKRKILEEMYKTYPKHKSAIDITLSNKAIDLAIKLTREQMEKEFEEEKMEIFMEQSKDDSEIAQRVAQRAREKGYTQGKEDAESMILKEGQVNDLVDRQVKLAREETTKEIKEGLEKASYRKEEESAELVISRKDWQEFWKKYEELKKK